jgi:GDPmannose 4,6-dehydratase
MTQKWLITGAGGFVASHYIDYLLEQKEEVIGSIRWNEDLSRIEHCKDKIKLVSADLLDLSSLIRLIADNKPDIISHLAAQSYVPDSYTNPIITVETNTIGTLNLFEAIRIVKDYIDKTYNPIIHVVSSSEVYGKVDEEHIPITIKHPFIPGNQYAIGKIGEDATAQFYNKYYGFKVIITRMFTHCGLRRTMMSAENSFAKQIALIEKGKQEPIIKHGNLNSVRTWADVRDAVQAYYLMIKDENVGKIYNIGGNTVKTIGEMLDYLISLSPLKDKIKKELDETLIRKLDVNLQIMDNSEFYKDTNWKPEYTFEQTMQDLLNWWRKNV